MSKAEKFIHEHTKNTYNYNSYAPSPTPWLTSDDARKAVEIAKEETTEKIKWLLKENYLIKSVEPLRWVSWEKVFNDLKQAMKDEKI